MSDEDKYNEDKYNEDKYNEDKYKNSSHLKTLYTDTKHLCAMKTTELLTSDRMYAHLYSQQHNYNHEIQPASVPVIVKDVTRPYTYYTMKSYGHAQDNNYYVNFDDHVSATRSGTSGHHYENEPGSRVTFDDSGCVKTYLCSLLGCFACCLFNMKPV